MSRVWFTADLHIGHAKVAKMRLFGEDWETNEVDPQNIADWHDLILARRWDDRVKPDDIVWVLGDISSGTKSAQFHALKWLTRRPGRKHLIAGNHDGVHPMHRDSHIWFPIYLQAFDTVQMAARRRIPLMAGDHPSGHVDALLSHFPYAGDHTSYPRYTQWRLPDEGRDFIIHGHTHSKERRNGRQIHVGVDAWDLSPVPLEAIVTLVNS